MIRRLLWLLLITAAVAQTPDQANANWIVVGNEAQPINPRHKKNIQDAISAAGVAGVVVIPPDYPFPSETFTNPNNILIMDFRRGTFAITGGGANFSGSSVSGTPNQIVAQTGVVSLASPMVTPGGATVSGELDVVGNSAIEFKPDFLCAYYGRINQNQLCSLNDILVWNPFGPNGDNQMVLTGQYRDISNNPPPNGYFYSWNSADGTLELTAPISIPQAAAGSVLASTSVGTAPVMQKKPVLDVRDFGVDCTGGTNSDVALNALTGNSPTSDNAITGHTLIFPFPCTIKLANTWLIKNQSAFIISGVTRSGANGGAGKSPAFVWTGAANGTVIDMEYVDGFVVEGLAVDGANSAATGINVDKTGAGGIVNTTDGIFRNLTVHSSATGGSGNANWIGIAISSVSTQNVEDMRVEDSSFYCGTRGAGVAAILIGLSSNAKNEILKHNNYTNCLHGVWAESGSVQILDSEFSSIGVCNGAGSDIRIDQNWDADIISGNVEENGPQFLSIADDGTSNIIFPIRISSNHFAPAGCENFSKFWIGTGQGGPAYDISDNGWDADASLFNVIGTTNTSTGNIYTKGNLWPNATPTPWWTIGANQLGGAQEMGLRIGNQLTTFSVAPSFLPNLQLPSPFNVQRAWIKPSGVLTGDDFVTQVLPTGGTFSQGSTYLIQHQQGTTGTSFFSFDGSYPGLNVAQMLTPPAINSVTPRGTTGGTTYTYAVVAFYGSTNSGGSPTTSTATGNASLSTSNYNELQFNPQAGATKYCIWRTVGGATQGNIGCIKAVLVELASGTPALAALITHGYPVNSVNEQNTYLFKDTGITGDASSLPTTNTTGNVSAVSYSTASNCAVNSASPAACGSAASGAVVIPTTTTTYTVNSTAVGSHSRIQLTWMSFAGDLPSAPTCVPPVNTTEPTISNIVAGVSFTIALGSTTGQTCPQFAIVNF